MLSNVVTCREMCYDVNFKPVCCLRFNCTTITILVFHRESRFVNQLMRIVCVDFTKVGEPCIMNFMDFVSLNVANE